MLVPPENNVLSYLVEMKMGNYFFIFSPGLLFLLGVLLFARLATEVPLGSDDTGEEDFRPAIKHFLKIFIDL